jgi:hypothetical protein
MLKLLMRLNAPDEGERQATSFFREWRLSLGQHQEARVLPAAKPVTDASLAYPDHAVVSMTKDELKKAPDFHYTAPSSQ